jgi:GntR family transcriptional regulator
VPLPFTVALRGGLSIHEQVVYAVTKAVVTGQLRSGDSFPSVRTLSQELKINPNTAHKVVSSLVDAGVLVVRPGIGTLVAANRPRQSKVPPELLEGEAERLVVAARNAGLSLQDVLAAIRRHWTQTIRRVS